MTSDHDLRTRLSSETETFINIDDIPNDASCMHTTSVQHGAGSYNGNNMHGSSFAFRQAPNSEDLLRQTIAIDGNVRPVIDSQMKHRSTLSQIQTSQKKKRNMMPQELKSNLERMRLSLRPSSDEPFDNVQGS